MPSITQPARTPPADPMPTAEARALLLDLAREIAFGVEELDAILVRKRITKIQYEKIANNPYFKHCLEGLTAEWQGVLNTETRVRLNYAYMVEKLGPTLYARASDPTEPLAAVNETVKTMAKLAGMGERNAAPNNGEKFLINIQIGDDKPLVHEVKTINGATVAQAEGDGHGNAYTDRVAAGNDRFAEAARLAAARCEIIETEPVNVQQQD